jgi:hypothetical protein
MEGATEGVKTYRESIRFAEERGLFTDFMGTKLEFLRVLFDVGGWDEILKLTSELRAWSQARDDKAIDVVALCNETHVRLWRGQVRNAGRLCHIS